jgi:hypothetical protein
VKNIRFFGSILLLTLLIQSVMFNLEKVMYADAAFSVFKMLNEEIIPVEHSRFAGSIMHLPAYLGLKIGLSAGMIFKLFVMGQWLFFIGIFSLLLFLRKPEFVLTLLLCLSGFMRESFYITTEMPIAMGFALVYGALLSTVFSEKKFRIYTFLGAILSLIASLYAHPAAIVFVLFFLLWHFIQQSVSIKTIGAHTLSIVLVFVFRFLLSPSSTYESDFFTQLISLKEFFYNLRYSNASRFFFQAYGGFYLPLLLIWGLSLRRLLMEEDKKPFYFVLLGMPLLWAVIVHIFSQGDVNPMMEKNFLILVMPVVFVFVFQLYKQQGGLGGFMFLFVVFFSFWSVSKTMESGAVYSDRLYQLDRLVATADKASSDKYFISQGALNQRNPGVWLVEWALPFETLLMSLNQNGKGDFTLSLKEDSTTNWESNRFYSVEFYPKLTVDKLNPRFFRLSEKKWLLFEQ